MSTILDALKRADAERQQGEVPGLHSPAIPGLALDPPTSRWRRGLWVLAVALIVTRVLLFTRDVCTLKVALDDPAGMRTLAGTVATSVLLLASDRRV